MKIIKKSAHWIGSNIITNDNKNVVSPPGTIVPENRTNIIVATPMRSGTHILIDLILNNIIGYKRSPLYVNIDAHFQQGLWTNNRIRDMLPNSGYVIKTHFPIRVQKNNQIRLFMDRLIKDSIVITVRRPNKDIIRSIQKWRTASKLEPENEDKILCEIQSFWNFWNDKSSIELDFSDLFEKEKASAFLNNCAEETCSFTRKKIIYTPSSENKNYIYIYKAATRLLGRRSPIINTTLYTLK